MAYRHKLLAHAKQLGHDSRIAIVGAGQMGRGFANQIHKMPGLAVSLIVDSNQERIEQTFKDLGISKFVISDNLKELAKSIHENIPCGTSQVSVVTDLEEIDLVVECTGVPNTGAKVTHDALQAKKDVVVLNVEMEVTVGPILNKIAQESNLVYGVAMATNLQNVKSLLISRLT